MDHEENTKPARATANDARPPLSANASGVEVAGATHRGGRDFNADAVLMDDAVGVYAVADGMGDIAVSARVARRALEVVQQMFGVGWASLSPAERAQEDAKMRIAEGVKSADWQLCSPYIPVRNRIGTTFAGLVACGETICAAHVGDSRLYLLRRSEARLVRLSEDHTVLGEDLSWGIPYDVAIRNPDAHKLTRVLGVRPGADVEPILQRWDLGDIAVILTDGVSDHVDAEVLERTLLDSADLFKAAHNIVDRAQSAGGRDNASVVLVRRVR
jgi:protein phosphatase